MNRNNLRLLGVLALSMVLTMSFLSRKPKAPKVKVPDSFVWVAQEQANSENPSTSGFFMSKYEVSNLDYRAFLNHLQMSGNTEAYEIARIDNEKWNTSAIAYGAEIFEETYAEHPAYNEYPVLNVSHDAAVLYCNWLTEIYNALNKEKYEVEFRLPTEEEWVYAARGGHKMAPYPWGGYYIRNSKGEILCNFKLIGPENIHFNRKTEEYEIMELDLNRGPFMTAPVKSFIPNSYGLYNMSGNAAERLAEKGHTKGGCWNSTGYDVRIDAADEFRGITEASPYISFRPIAVIVDADKE